MIRTFEQLKKEKKKAKKHIVDIWICVDEDDEMSKNNKKRSIPSYQQ